MNVVRQLLRQPLKFVSGILIISIAVALLCVCMGQSIVAERTEGTMERHFTTIALQTNSHRYIEKVVETDFGEITYQDFLEEVPEEIIALITNLEKEHPELVQTVANHGLASAYIPELKPDNMSDYQYHYPLIGTQESIEPHNQETDAPYADAVLEIVVDTVEITNHLFIDGVKEDGTKISMESALYAEVKGRINNVLALETGWDNPVGRTAVLSLKLQSLEDFEALQLEAGGKYLVYGINYEDGNWKLKGEIARQLGQKGIVVDWQEIDTNRIRYRTGTEQIVFDTAVPMVGIYEHFDKEAQNYFQGYVGFTEQTMAWHNAITMDVIDCFTEGTYSYIRHETGAYPEMDYTRYITGENGNQVLITEEEWCKRYEVPLIARLEGTAEDFLASEKGTLWQRQLEYLEINYHAFHVIGVEKLGYVADFSRENARIITGRDFTEDELKHGDRVCILSETIAAANGLSVGDTVTPQFYNYDYDNPNQEYISDGRGIINPWPYKFTATTEWAGNEEYTIIGLYRQNNAWGDVSENLYSFTPNTIFVPITSVTSDMDYGNQGFFQTLVLKNGAVEEFRALVDEAGYEDLFVYYDQEYTTITDTLINYREVAGKARIVGIIVYMVILFLFLFLFPGSLGKTLTIMTALGAKQGQKMKQVVISSIGILLPGTVSGTILGMLLWETMISRFSERIGETIALKMEPSVLTGIAIVQLGLAVLLSVLLTVPMSRMVGRKRRK